MFTGIVEEMGRVADIVKDERTARLTIAAPLVHQGVQIGDSIAINGCCLTVVAQIGETLTFEAVPETMNRTNLGELEAGHRVNLERSLAVGGRLGGHFVQGHIDGVGTVAGLATVENAVVVEVAAPSALRRYFVEKGSVAVDGISLTVAEITPEGFTVWTIPHTRAVTTLGDRRVGARVNLECDLIGKYIERLVSFRQS